MKKEMSRSQISEIKNELLSSVNRTMPVAFDKLLVLISQEKFDEAINEVVEFEKNIKTIKSNLTKLKNNSSSY